VDRSCLLISVFKQQSTDKKFIIEVCCLAYFFEDYTLWAAVTAVVRLLWRRSCFR